MIILLISWACASVVICLAFLRVAARQVPRIEEQMAAGCEPPSRQPTAVAVRKTTMVYPPPWSKFPSPRLQAKREKAIQAQLDDPLLSPPSIPLVRPGMGRSRVSPGWDGGDPAEYRVEFSAPGVSVGARAVAQTVLQRQAVNS